jgi:hypothetical protein
MDAPKGRYRVEEKDGRLIVIDTATGAPASPASPSARPVAPPPLARGAVSTPPGPVDLYSRLLLGLVVRTWDEEGRAVVAWEWEQNGRKRRWDAALGPAEQKRLGRALAGISMFPVFVLLTILSGFGLVWLLPVAMATTFWGTVAIGRLQRETGSR